MSLRMDQPDRPSLVRAIRRWDLLALTLNSVIGAGIFGLPARVFGLSGSYSLFAFIACTLVVVLIVLCYAEVSSRFVDTGGPYLYAYASFGKLVGFEVGWLMWLARLTAFAANCNLMVGYLSFFWPAAGAGVWRATVITITVLALTVINVIGVRQATITGNIFTVGKLVPLVLFVAVGLFFIQPARFSFAGWPSAGNFSQAVLLLVYAFSGFEMSAIPAGETDNPRLNLPIALLIGIGVVVTLYILIQLVCIGTLPELAASAKPLADAGSRFLGPAGGALISAGALISITGNLNVIVMSGSRIPFAMAERAELPALLARTHPRFRTPHVAIIVSSAITLLITLFGTFISALTISTIARLVYYGTTCAALPTLRRQKGATPAMFKAPAGLLVATAALGIIGWLLANSTRLEAEQTLLVAAVGLVLYFVFGWVRTLRT
jgi:amino acid transporter